MIRVTQLEKSFAGQRILKKIDLEIYDNETRVILGPSGQGKTVLIKCLIRLLEPDSGNIVYDGLDITHLKKTELEEFRKKIAFVFQESALFDFLNVKDNLSIFLKMHTKLSDREIQTKILRALRFVGLDEEVFEKYPAELSGGMQKRVAIARAVVKEPEYIFYDEPTTGLDKTNAEKISDIIEMLKEEIRATSIVVTHDIKLMKKIADRVALLRQGEIMFVGKKEAVSPEILEELYKVGELHGL